MRRKALIFIFLGCFVISILLSAEPSSYKIIVNKSNSVTSMSKADISKLFLKKVTKWENDMKVLVVDQSENAEVRINFTKEILGKGVSAIKSYWQQQLFSGNATPPPTKDTDESVIKYVEENPGAIGYVSEDADVSDVKILKIPEK
jgi:ABC-type phosphate transport system substrate-binding protein